MVTSQLMYGCKKAKRKPNHQRSTIKQEFHHFKAEISTLKELCKASTGCGRQVSRWQLDSKVHSLSPGQDNCMNKM